jgi:hypothetical protein
MDIDALTISGGACNPTVEQPVPPSWQYDARLCKTSDRGTCDDPDQVCARTPEPPYISALCVTRIIGEGEELPECPAAYSHRYDPLYGNVTDTRGCSACVCSAPSGGSCTGKITISGGLDCSSPGKDYVLSTPSAPTPLCQPFNLGAGGIHPTHVIGQYVVTPPGTCNVTTKPTPTGSAKPSGRVTVVCCQ